MQMNPGKSALLDSVVGDYLDAMPEGDAKVLLGYSHLLHQAWRSTLASLPISPTWRTLDVGSGLGLIPFELAGHLPIKVWGVDIDPRYVDVSRELEQRLRAANYFPPGSSVTFDVGDINALPYGDESFDFVIVREVFLYLRDPEKAASELSRVSARKGQILVEETDDGLYITWPPSPPSLAKLHASIGVLQNQNGGDRVVGRKMSTYLRSANLSITGTKLISEAHHLAGAQLDHERNAILLQLASARHRLMDAGILTGDEFDSAMQEYRTAELGEQFRIAARVLVSAQKD